MVKLTAVILAAGRGTRLGSTLDGKPKGFLPFKETTFIERALDILAAAGIDHTIIVTGFGASHYNEIARQRAPKVSTLYNVEFAEKGSMQSLLVALEQTSGPILVLDADIVYESRAISEMVQSPHENAILISAVSGAGDENLTWMETDNSGLPRLSLISKDLAARAEPCYGEHVAIVKLSEALAEALRTNCDPNFSYEQCLVNLLAHHAVRPVDIPDLIWTEVDDVDMWNRAQKDIFPKLV